MENVLPAPSFNSTMKVSDPKKQKFENSETINSIKYKEEKLANMKKLMEAQLKELEDELFDSN